MITPDNYIKNINDMTTDERLLLIDNAEEWMAKYPELRASVTSWEDAPVKDFDEGLMLCTCLRKAHSFVKSAYQFNAKKCLDMIQNTLKEVVRIARPGGPRTESEKKTVKVKAFITKQPAPDEDGNVKRLTEADRKRMEEEAMDEERKNDKWRPQNLDSYIHLLSKETQQECRNVQRKYYLPLREYRSRLESLVENPDATQDQRKEMAGLLMNAEEMLAAFWEKVDKEYKRMTGQGLPEEPSREKKLSEYTKEDIDKVEDEDTREKLKTARIENNKKYLRRGDLPDNEDTRRQLSLRAREMTEWGMSLTKRQVANLNLFGLSVSDEKEGTTLFDQDKEKEE